MSARSIAAARNRLSDLIDRAQQGEPVVITRPGKPVAEIKALPAAARPMTRDDLAWLDVHRVPRRNALEDAGTLLSRMCDEEQR